MPDVDKLMYCPILLRYFKENYLSLYGLELGMVSNQALVVQFLKSTSFHCLDIGKMCNLEQEFFDEIADFLTVAMLRLNDRALRPLRDFSFLTKLNFRFFSFYFKHCDPREAVLTILKKPSCYYFNFNRLNEKFKYEEDSIEENSNSEEDSESEFLIMKRILSMRR